jgi:glycosyltransferase involved in cell wall biosynthesis
VIDWAPYQFTSVHLTLRKPVKQGAPNNQWANPRKLAETTYPASAHNSQNGAPAPEFQNRVAGSSTPRYWTKRDGVNILGDLGGDFGLAVAARKMVDLMLERGIPISYVHKHFNPLSNTLGQKYAALDPNPVHRINLSNLNMRETKYLFDRAQWIAFTGAKYTIANWYWELPTPPKDLLEVFGWVDEIWVASHYVRESMARASTVPVHVIPPFIEVQAPAVPNRSKFGLAGGRHIMLYNFSALSGYSRKNPFAVIEAYRRAFGNSTANDAPLLLIKAQFLDQLPELATAVQRAVDAVGGVLLTKDYSRTEYDELVACADSYVSLHRCEGFGFGLADAMYLGKPVIATNYSSNVDFMTEDNSFPVNFTLRTIQEDDFTFQPSLAKVYEVGQIWAEPDLDHAAALMTTVVNQPDLAAERGRRAASDIRDNYSAARIGAIMEQRLTEIDLGQTTAGETFVASQSAQSGQDVIVVNDNSAASPGQATSQTPVVSTMKASTLTQIQSRLKHWNTIRNNYMFYGFGNFMNKLPVIGHVWRMVVRLVKLGRTQNAEYQMFQSMVEYLAQIPGEVQIIRYEMSRLETAGNASQQSIVEGVDRKIASEFASLKELKETVETLRVLVSKVNRELAQLEQIKRALTQHVDTALAHGAEDKLRELISAIRLLDYQIRAQPLVGVAHGNDQFAEYEDALQVVRWLETQNPALADKNVEIMFQDSRADRAVAEAAAYFGDRISVLAPSIIYYFNFLPEWDIAAFADRVEGRIPNDGYVVLIVPKREAGPHAAFEQDYGTLKSQPAILASADSGRSFFVHMWKKSTGSV